MTTWLMPDEWIDKMNALELASVAVSQEIASTKTASAAAPRIKRGVAEIQIKGTLVKQSSKMLEYFGIDQTSYEDVAAQTESAVSKGAKKIIYRIDSPGGDVNGILIGMDAIKNAGVPTEVISDGYLTSGAYMLASQADKITAENELVTVGSIGVATSRFVSNNVKDITNSDSKNKRPDVSNEEGISVVEGELDDIYQVLAERIAEGRNTSIDAVKRDYGQGAVMTARSALQKKMIDGIISINQPADSAAIATGAINMNPNEVKEQYRTTYDAIFEAGKAAGSAGERDRVCAHLTLADGSGDVNAAHEAIREGIGITEMVKARHMSAAMKRGMSASRQSENPPPVDTSTSAPNVENLAEAKARAEFQAAHPGWEVE